MLDTKVDDKRLCGGCRWLNKSLSTHEYGWCVLFGEETNWEGKNSLRHIECWNTYLPTDSAYFPTKEN